MTLMDVRLYQKCCKRSLSSKQLIYEKYGHPANKRIFTSKNEIIFLQVLNLIMKEVGKVDADEIQIGSGVTALRAGDSVLSVFQVLLLEDTRKSLRKESF
ncbi:unnamed protein product [Brugia pahangi]|uniref:Molybdopterin molybdenumtransferase n=1 Tax=Brugia pahangi TaxID=6280 RepID=A0A0N4TZP8_BRUPA|nr:unnamed protein product [Brugia pahangi]